MTCPVLNRCQAIVTGPVHGIPSISPAFADRAPGTATIEIEQAFAAGVEAEEKQHQIILQGTQGSVAEISLAS